MSALAELEAAEAPATRDPLLDPQPGDWFVDYGVVREAIALVAFRTNGGTVTTFSADYLRERKARVMTPAEVQAFKENGTRPTVSP